MQQLGELIFNAALIVVAVVTCSGGDPLKEPYRINACLVASGPEAEDMTTELWSDQVEVYFKKYPGSYCGKCGQEVKCPKED